MIKRWRILYSSLPIRNHTMSSSLEDLFEQIIYSEKKAQERKSLLNDLKLQQIEYREEIKHIEKDIKSYQGQVVVKVQQWNDCVAQQTSLKIQRDILKAQLDTLLSKKKHLKQQLDDANTSLLSGKDQFFQAVKSFSLDYDLCSQGREKRMREAETFLQRLHNSETKLENDLRDYRDKQASIIRLTSERDECKKEAAQVKETLKKLELVEHEEDAKLLVLENERTKVMSVPQTDPEYIRIQSELDSCKDTDMEDVITALHAELQDLQQQKWQKELQCKRHLQEQQKFAYTQARKMKDEQVNKNRDIEKGQPNTSPCPSSNVRESTAHCLSAKPNLDRLKEAMKIKSNQETDKSSSVFKPYSTAPPKVEDTGEGEARKRNRFLWVQHQKRQRKIANDGSDE